MAYDFQVTVDCDDPHVLAGWWAETLGWQVEPTNEAFIREMLDKGYATEAETRTYQGQLVWKEAAAIRAAEPVPGRPPPRRLLFQAVPETKTVKNRVHLDLRVSPDDVEAKLETLTARGAKFLHRGRQGPHTWITLADPEGNEFCIS